MGSHGIRNRSPHSHRVSATSLTPRAPSGWAMVNAGITACLIVALWAVAVLFIFSL